MYIDKNKRNMNIEERIEFAREVFEQVLIPILRGKGKDYSTNDDANSNFRAAAEDMREDISHYDVWHIYFHKHLCALKSWLKSLQAESEPIEYRIADLINYLLILWSMAVDDGKMGKPWEMEGAKLQGTTLCVESDPVYTPEEDQTKVSW